LRGKSLQQAAYEYFVPGQAAADGVSINGNAH
jgi:hypothetical protein